ncbi:MAG: fructose-6-phosphate aldolase [Alphaproteobacteria bacterium]|nr:fructose-6-phosphate aldolase [Alphaproteobacteria bacterium]
MLYMLDSANIEEIRKACDVFPLAGVTTNPSIITREKKDFFSLLKEIRSVIGNKMMHVQVLGTTTEDMLKDAASIREKVDGSLFIKIPVSDAGYKAMQILKKDGFGITATAIYTPQQALIAANCGADFTAPYVNRIDNISGMGVNVVSMITDLFNLHGLSTRVLAASFKNVQQVHEVALAGTHSVTVGADILWKLARHPLTDMSVEQFTKDWNAQYGEGKCIYNM